MLVTFSTRHGRLVMLGEPAVRLLRLGGHSGSVPGAVLAPDLAAFLARLHKGLDLHGGEPSPQPAPEPDRDERDDEPRERPIALRQRAVPLLDMIRIAIQRESDLMWERA
jgi:hypothetical protein